MGINILNHKTQKRLAILLFIGIVLVMFLILLGAGEFRHLKSWIYANHIHDKITHIAFGAILTFLASYILHPRALRFSRYEINLGTFIMFLLVSFDEISQVFLPGRDADPLDLLASYIGVVTGYILYRLWAYAALSSKKGLSQK